MSDESVRLPPFVYLPTQTEAKAGDEEFEAAFVRAPDGRMALPVYTALDRLEACCGAGQPWIVLPTDKLAEIQAVAELDAILLDAELPEELRREGDAVHE